MRSQCAPNEENTGAANKGGRHHALDLTRGLCALTVSQYHFMTWNGIATVESMGTFAVYTFFVLSAVTMMMVYGGKFASGIAPQAAREFFRNRFARLMPLLALVAVLAYVRQAISGTIDLTGMLLTGSGLMALHMPGYLSNSVGAWSLGIELAFYAVFPVIVILARSWRDFVVAALVLLIGQHLVLWRIAASEQFWHYYVSNLIFAPFFALGCLIACDHRGRNVFMLPIALVGLVVLLGFSFAIKTNLMQDQISYFALTMLCAFTIWAAWRSDVPIIIVPFGAFLGDISYSLYLSHWLVNDVLRVLHLPLALHWIAYIVGILSGSYVCYRLIELPARNWLRGSNSSTAQLP